MTEGEENQLLNSLSAGPGLTQPARTGAVGSWPARPIGTREIAYYGASIGAEPRLGDLVRDAGARWANNRGIDPHQVRRDNA